MTEISQNIFMTEKNSQHYQERNFMEREIISIVLKKIMNGPMNHFLDEKSVRSTGNADGMEDAKL